MLRIKLVRSKAGTRWQQNATCAALGLRKMNQVVEKDDNPSIRGMIHHVRHMVSVEVVEGEVAKKAAKPAKAAAAAKTAEPKAEAPKAAKATKPAAAKPKAKTPAKKAVTKE